MVRASHLLVLALAIAALGVASAKRKDTDGDRVPNTLDTCPRVRQPTQTGTQSYCSTVNCDESCRIGCRVANNANECTQEHVKGEDLVCRRCNPGFHPIPDSDFGCTPNVAGSAHECTQGGDYDRDSVGNRQDNCPLISNPGQEKRYCSTTVPGNECHPSCRRGCSTGPTACTTPVSKSGVPQPCQRCSVGYHPVGATACDQDVPGTAYNCHI